jgi:hypothetical protein
MLHDYYWRFVGSWEIVCVQMLHDYYWRFVESCEICLCKCYMITIEGLWVAKIVCVQMLHDTWYCELWNCLCKCYELTIEAYVNVTCCLSEIAPEWFWVVCYESTIKSCHFLFVSLFLTSGLHSHSKSMGLLESHQQREWGTYNMDSDCASEVIRFQTQSQLRS